MQNHAEVVNEPEPNFISEAGTLHASPKDAENHESLESLDRKLSMFKTQKI